MSTVTTDDSVSIQQFRLRNNKKIIILYQLWKELKFVSETASTLSFKHSNCASRAYKRSLHNSDKVNQVSKYFNDKICESKTKNDISAEDEK